jgi:hypothetical protein
MSFSNPQNQGAITLKNSLGNSLNPATEETATEISDTISSAYIVRQQDTGTYLYIGKAVPGSSSASAVWQIQRLENSTGNIFFADGNANFDNIWDNRASLSYS